MLVNRTPLLRPASGRQAAPVRSCRAAPSAAAVASRRSLCLLRAQTGDDSDMMGEENFVGGRPQAENVFTEQDLKSGDIEGSGQDTPMKPQDIGQGRMEEVGTEYGQATEERSSSGGSDTGSQPEGGAQEMSQAPPVSDEGGRFDEEPQMADSPYDPRPRERGHGVPPHKDSSNTGPAGESSSGQEQASTPQASEASTPQAGETSETSARDEFKQDRM